MNMKQQNKLIAFVGSYAEASTPGLYACYFDNENGRLDIVHSVDGLQNPTFLAIDEQMQTLYAIADETNEEGQRYGLIASYQVNAETLDLTLLNKEKSVDASTCHIALDYSNKCLIVSSYGGGMIGLSPKLDDGRVGINADVHQLTGSSIAPAQTQARAHSVFMDPSNRFAIVSDLGSDQIVVYKLDLANYKLLRHSQVATAPGAGPRHFVFHPTHSYGYVINELNSTVTGYSFDEENGVLTEFQTISTLPTAFDGDNACADIHVSPDGKFLYGSNRGHDSIVVYAIDSKNGSLTHIEHVSTLGEHPRNFALSPDGRFLLVANRDTNNIVTFTRDASTGKLEANGNILEVSRPVCLKFLT